MTSEKMGTNDRIVLKVVIYSIPSIREASACLPTPFKLPTNISCEFGLLYPIIAEHFPILLETTLQAFVESKKSDARPGQSSTFTSQRVRGKLAISSKALYEDRMDYVELCY